MIANSQKIKEAIQAKTGTLEEVPSAPVPPGWLGAEGDPWAFADTKKSPKAQSRLFASR